MLPRFFKMKCNRTKIENNVKIDIINDIEIKKMKKMDVAAKYRLPCSTISTILKNKEKIKNYNGKSQNRTTQAKIRKENFEDIEVILYEWIKQYENLNLPLSQDIIRQKSIEIGEKLGHWNFKSSNGWFDRFRKRYNLKNHKICGESGGVNEEVIVDWLRDSFYPLLKSYNMTDIYNVDETALFYELLPGRTYTITEKGNSFGSKQPKSRITVLLCCNLDGTDKVELLCIGKYNKPRCFKNLKELPIKYTSNKNAWMTRVIFNDFLTDLNSRMLKRNKKILLLLDQCSAHQKDLVFSNIKLLFFPPNTTSKLQPLDAGIIHSLKVNYRKLLLRAKIDEYETFLLNRKNELDVFFPKKISILDALKFIKLCWSKLSIDVISNCSRKSLQLNSNPILNNFVPDALLISTGDSTMEIQNDLAQEFELLNNLERLEITSSLQSVDEIIDGIKEQENGMEIDEPINEILNYDEPITTYDEAIKGLQILEKYSLEKGIYSQVSSNLNEIRLTLINSKVLVQSKITMYMNLLE